MNRPAYGASRRAEGTNPLKSSDGPARARDKNALERLSYAYKLLCSAVSNKDGMQELVKHTSNLALITAKGFSINPTVVLAAAPDSMFPVPVSFGKTEAC